MLAQLVDPALADAVLAGEVLDVLVATDPLALLLPLLEAVNDTPVAPYTGRRPFG